MSSSIKDKAIYQVEITVSHERSHMDDILRGRIPTGIIRGGINHREAITEAYLVTGLSRDDAILTFRRLTGWSGAFESVREIDHRHAQVIHDEMSRSNRGRRVTLPQGELDEIEALIAADRRR